MDKAIQKIVNSYAHDVEDLTLTECMVAGFSVHQCGVISEALNVRRQKTKYGDNIINSQPPANIEEKLEMAGLSKEFIQKVTGENRYKILQKRAQWLAGHAVNKPWRWFHSDSERASMIYKAGARGAAARESVPLIIEALKDDNPNVRAAAIAALGMAGDASAAPALIEAIVDKELFDYYAREALVKIGVPAVPALISALQSKDTTTKIKNNVAMALGKIGAKGAVPALIEAIDGDNYDLCENVIFALSEIDDERAFLFLLGLLKNENERVRWMTARAFGFKGVKRAVPALIELAEDKNIVVRDEVIAALGNIKDERAVPVLIKIFNDQEGCLRYSDKCLKVTLRALKDIGRPAVPVILKAYKENYFRMPERAVKLLAEIGDPDALPVIEDFLKSDRETWERREIIRILGEWGMQAMPLLLDLLTNGSDWKYSVVTYILVNMDTSISFWALPDLDDIIADNPDPERRKTAQWVKDRILEKIP